MARPTKLTDEIGAAIEMAVGGGASFRAAAGHAGVGESTFHEWMQRGRAERERLDTAEGVLGLMPTRPRSAKSRKAKEATKRAAAPLPLEEPFLAFWERVVQADCTAQVRAAAFVSKAGADEWRAAAWMLERRDPETWGPARMRIAVEGSPDGAPIRAGLSVDLAHASDAELELLQSIAARGAAGAADS